jgi:hypothetical protein
MADPIVPVVKPGEQTSEYKVTKIAVGVGAVLQAASLALSFMPQDNKFVSIASLICGTALQILSGLGYYRSRTAVKVAALENNNGDT